MKSFLQKLPRVAAVSFDIATGLLVTFVAIKVKPSELASFMSVVYVFSIIIPGLILTGYARKACLGDVPTKKNLLLYVLTTFLINFLMTLLFFVWIKNRSYPLEVILGVVSFFSLTSVFQPLNIIWYYIYEDKIKYFKVKLTSSLIRLLGALFSIIFNEVGFVILFLSLTQITDAFFGIKLLGQYKSKVIKNSPETSLSYLMYGLSIGVSRLINSVIKILIERVMTAYLPTLLLFEQIFSGLVGLYERYFISYIRMPRKIILLKYIWMTFVFFYYIYFYTKPGSIKNSTLLLFLMSSLSILPPYYTYNAMQKKGLMHVALISIIISSIIILFLIINYFWIKSDPIYGLIYMLVPSMFFYFFEKKLKIKVQ